MSPFGAVLAVVREVVLLGLWTFGSMAVLGGIVVGGEWLGRRLLRLRRTHERPTS